MSIVAGLTYPAPLAGIFAMSGYLLLPGKLRQLIPKENVNQETSIWMGHGDRDPLVRYEWGKLTAEKLSEWGYKVEFRTYQYVVLFRRLLLWGKLGDVELISVVYSGLEHSADPKEIDDLEKWLRERLPPSSDEKASAGGNGGGL